MAAIFRRPLGNRSRPHHYIHQAGHRRPVASVAPAVLICLGFALIVALSCSPVVGISLPLGMWLGVALLAAAIAGRKLAPSIKPRPEQEHGICSFRRPISSHNELLVRPSWPLAAPPQTRRRIQ